MSSAKEKGKEKMRAGSYTLFPESYRFYSSKDIDAGERRKVEMFETEHHVYTVPFLYDNVEVEGWSEYSDKGIEIAADRGSITITEEKPIISATVVGSGCSGANYNIVEWWGPGEELNKLSRMSKKANQLVKRQRIGNLLGQHSAWIQRALSQEHPDFKSLEEAVEFIKKIQNIAYNMTSGYYVPGSLMSGLYENTAYFRIGDTSSPQHTAYKVVIRGGGLDYEDPGDMFADGRTRYPADYAFRLIDLVLKK